MSDKEVDIPTPPAKESDALDDILGEEKTTKEDVALDDLLGDGK